MYQDFIRMPKDRIAILVGVKGTIKKRIEKETNTKILIDSQEGEVIISSDNAYNIQKTKSVIKAIARGFNPEIALQLLDDEYYLEIINIKDYSGKSKAKLLRLKARCIGTAGKAKETIQELTNVSISIYGKTISIIGLADSVFLARKAMDSLLIGAKHGNVYKQLEKSKPRFKKEM